MGNFVKMDVSRAKSCLLEMEKQLVWKEPAFSVLSSSIRRGPFSVGMVGCSKDIKHFISKEDMT